MHSVFPKADHTVERDPHKSIVFYLRQMFDRVSSASAVEGQLRSLLFSSPPEFGFDYIGWITGFYDEEFMPQSGLSHFDEGEAFWVNYEGATYYDEVLYSRDEFRGWLTLGLRQAGEINGNSRAYAEIMERMWSPRRQVEALSVKLNGAEPWFHGPVGSKFDEADKIEWSSYHVAGFSKRYS